MSKQANSASRETVTRALLIVGIIGIAIALATFTGKPSDGNMKEGESAPDFTLPALDGSEISLSDYRGQGVMLMFWGTWCGYCVQEMPLITKMADDYGSDDFSILSIAINDRPGHLRKFLESMKNEGVAIDFPILLDPKGALKKDYKLQGVPYFVFINGEGTITQSYVGEVGESYLREAIEAL